MGKHKESRYRGQVETNRGTLYSYSYSFIIYLQYNLLEQTRLTYLYEQEKFEKKKAEYAEKMKNKADLIHKKAEEKRAMVLAQKGEATLTASEKAAHFRATETAPKKGMGCFGG